MWWMLATDLNAEISKRNHAKSLPIEFTDGNVLNLRVYDYERELRYIYPVKD